MKHPIKARISHQLPAAADDAQCPAVFSRIGMLDGLSSTTPRPSGRKPHWTMHLAALATKVGEKCGLAVVALAAVTAIAGETEYIDYTELSLEDLAAVAITSATMRSQKAEKVPATVYVITDRDFERYGYRDLADVLKHTPGIEYGNPHSWLQGGQRGFSGSWSQTKLLINGLEANLLWSGEAYISNQFPLYNVKRIEIIQGPASALYGADAFVGVINIVTVNSDNSARGGSVKVSSDYLDTAFDSREASAVWVDKKGNFGYTLGVSFFDQDGPDFTEFVRSSQFSEIHQEERIALLESGNPYLDENRVFNANIDLRYDIGRGTSLAGGVYYLSNVDGGGHENPELSFTEFEDTREQTHAYLKYSKEFLSGAGRFSLEYHHLEEDDLIRFQSRTDTSVLPPPVLHFEIEDSVMDKVTARFDLGIDSVNNFLIVGATYKDVSIALPQFTLGDFSNLSPFLEQEKWSVFVQDQQMLLDGRVELTLGARFDHQNIYDDVLSLRGGLNIEIVDGTAVKLLYGEAFREPTIFELTDNPALDPAEMRTAEIAIHHKLAATLTGQVSVFRNRATGIIQQDRGGSNVNVNQGAKTSQGLEMLFKWKHGKMEGEAWYSIVDVSDHLEVAKHRFGLGLVYDLSARVSASVRGKYTSSVRTQALRADGEKDTATVREYVTVDLTLFARDLPVRGTATTYKIGASVHNLFNSTNFFANVRGPDPIMFMDRGRSLRVSGSVQF